MAKNGEEAVALAALKRPDIITMGIHMPRMDGYEATRGIMEECPAPIVIVTSNWEPEDVENFFRAIDAGALTALEKPPGPGDSRSKPLVAKLLQTLKTMSGVKVVRRFPRQNRPGATLEAWPAEESRVGRQRVEVVAIGASTGGPPLIKTILSGLKQGFFVPILIVQHIAVGFLTGMVKRSAGDLLEILNNILEFSKDEARDVSIEKHVFDIKWVLSYMNDHLGPKAKEKGIEFFLDLRPDVPSRLVGDHKRLQQILEKLMGNAIKFTEIGEIVLGVAIAELKEDLVVLDVVVSDTGVGIPPDKIESIFDGFTQADGSSTRKYGGTGLGLALSKRSVDLMGGSIWV
jgi:signal transduction histidine kinase